MTLKEQRQALATACYNSYNPDAPCGGKAWREHNKHVMALDAFDAEHPEIIAEIEAALQAECDGAAQESWNRGD